ncbi:MAG: DUF1553 domain-containing protein, partial [Maioricimonas sp. JB049]
ALHLLNSDFSLQCARGLAGRLTESSMTGRERIEQCYALLLGRMPGPEEIAAAEAFLQRGTTADAWTDFCLAMFNLNEFVYLD